MVSEPLVEAVIQQLNLGYDAQQDRLLLKIGLADDSEIALWLTRRLVRTLWTLLQGSNPFPIVAPDQFTPATRELLESFSQESAAQKLDFSEAYRSNRTSLSQQPGLVVDCSINNAGGGPPTLELAGPDGHTVRLILTSEITLALGNMLQLTAKEAAWDLAFVGSQVVISENNLRHVLH